MSLLQPASYDELVISYSYAGWLGTVAAKYTVKGKLADEVPSPDESRHRLAAVAGTSTCHIVQVCS